MENINLVVNVKIGFDEPTQKFLETLLGNIPIAIPVSKDRAIDLTRQQNNITESISKIDKNIKLLDELLSINKINNNAEVEKESKETDESITLEMLRSELSEILKGGNKELAKQILDSVGAKKLTDVAVEDYSKLMKRIKEVK